MQVSGTRAVLTGQGVHRTNVTACWVVSCLIISLTESNSGTVQKLPFEVNTTIGLQNMTATSDNTGTLLGLKCTPLDAIIVW